jgi:hypothetical protein
VFDHRHYVPILRWKEAERFALRDLQDQLRSRMTPLAQLVPESIAVGKRRPTVSQMLQKVAADMAQHWGTRPLFVDRRCIDAALRVGEHTHPLVYLAEQARRTSVSMVPVTGLHRDSAYQTAVAGVVAEDRRGACLRLFRTDLVSPNLREEIFQVLDRLTSEPSRMDLVVDLQCFNGNCPSIDKVSSLLPELRHWRTFSVASGAFSRDLTQFKTVGRHSLPRLDWQAWHQQIEPSRTLIRKPTYGDYGVYHPIYTPPQFPNPSASIRYTTHEEWVIMKGQGVLNEGGPGPRQWPANAQLLCGMPEFCGATFSAGDAYIFDKAEHPHPTGSARTWLQAGFSHHLTFVVRQIASLFAT